MQAAISLSIFKLRSDTQIVTISNPLQAVLISSDSVTTVSARNPVDGPDVLCVVRSLDEVWRLENPTRAADVLLNGKPFHDEPLEEGSVVTIPEGRILVSFDGPAGLNQYATTVRASDGSDDASDDSLDDTAKAELREAGYTLYQELGRGAFARVVLAKLEATGEYVAIKILHAELRSYQAEFLREIRSLRELRHPHVVTVHDSGTLSSGVGWLAMDCIAGTNLRDLVRSRGTLSEADTCDIVRQVLSGLSAAHSLPPPVGPLVHRDVKPSNILVTGSAGAYTAVLADFGLAKNSAAAGFSGITRTGEVRGTLNFMSAEQLRDSKYVGAEADVFAVGAVLYFCLTGQYMYFLPSNVGQGDLIEAIASRAIVPLQQRRPQTSQPLVEIFDRSVGRDAVRRYLTCDRFLHAVEQFRDRGMA
ncbi:MAG: serine/threonine-protein kinase [Planctomycetaceae bacterium]